jgi:hypothetical protein
MTLYDLAKALWSKPGVSFYNGPLTPACVEIVVEPYQCLRFQSAEAFLAWSKEGQGKDRKRR